MELRTLGSLELLPRQQREPCVVCQNLQEKLGALVIAQATNPCMSLCEEHLQLISLRSAFLSSVNTASSFIQTVPQEPGTVFTQEWKFPFGQGKAALGVHISGQSCVYPQHLVSIIFFCDHFVSFTKFPIKEW